MQTISITTLLEQQETPIEPAEAQWLAAGCIATQLVRGDDVQAKATRDLLDMLFESGVRLPLLNWPTAAVRPLESYRSVA